ncbi:MAG: hypothetical protein HZA01_10620 [Nitrospinae bacterium]|nr:hypothetical protein [Nitrospinota bacterium]
MKFIINVNPIFCCPGLISEALYKKLEKEIGIPIVSITYDGTRADKNKALKPYLHFAVQIKPISFSQTPSNRQRRKKIAGKILWFCDSPRALNYYI